MLARVIFPAKKFGKAWGLLLLMLLVQGVMLYAQRERTIVYEGPARPLSVVLTPSHSPALGFEVEYKDGKKTVLYEAEDVFSLVNDPATTPTIQVNEWGEAKIKK